MPVGVMLSQMSSVELTEWMAYNKLTGAVSRQSWRDWMALKTEYAIQCTNHILGAAHLSHDGDGNPIQNPVPEPEIGDLPHESAGVRQEMRIVQESLEDDEDDEDDDEEE